MLLYACPSSVVKIAMGSVTISDQQAIFLHREKHEKASAGINEILSAIKKAVAYPAATKE